MLNLRSEPLYVWVVLASDGKRYETPIKRRNDAIASFHRKFPQLKIRTVTLMRSNPTSDWL